MKHQHLRLTPKQVAAIISALRSTAEIRGTERERDYLRRTLKAIKEQTC